MKIEFDCKVEGGRITGNAQQLRDTIGRLSNGNYTITIQAVNPLTTRGSCRKAYFKMIDICVAETGNDKYTIHEEFKQSIDQDTTEYFTVAEWIDFINKFKIFAYNKMNCIV